MITETEATFIDIDKELVRSKLSDLGAELVSAERLMRRRVYHPPAGKRQNDWYRVRDEGTRVTMSYKKLHQRTVAGVEELELEIDDFDVGCQFLDKTGVEFVAYQETKRESWVLGNTKVEIDEWPWIPPFVEVEGSSEKEVRETAERLGFKWPEAFFGSVENIYQHKYDVTEDEVNSWPEIVFSPVPEWLKQRRK